MRELAGVEVALTQEEEARLATLQEESDLIEREWADADELPEEISARIDELDREIGALVDRPVTHEPQDIAMAGVFIAIDLEGALVVERGFVRPEDEPVEETDAHPEGGEADAGAEDEEDLDRDDDEGDGDVRAGPSGPSPRSVVTGGDEAGEVSDEEALEAALAPAGLRSDRMAHAGLAGCAGAQSRHGLRRRAAQPRASDLLPPASENCLTLSATKVSFGYTAEACATARPPRPSPSGMPPGRHVCLVPSRRCGTRCCGSRMTSRRHCLPIVPR
jgi:ParB family chromosome partitioning protein